MKVKSLKNPQGKLESFRIYTKATATNPKITLKAIAKTPGIKNAWLKI